MPRKTEQQPLLIESFSSHTKWLQKAASWNRQIAIRSSHCCWQVDAPRAIEHAARRQAAGSSVEMTVAGRIQEGCFVTLWQCIFFGLSVLLVKLSGGKAEVAIELSEP